MSARAFRAISGKALNTLEISEKGANVDVEMLMQAHKRGLEIVEVPIECRYPRSVEPSGKNSGAEK